MKSENVKLGAFYCFLAAIAYAFMGALVKMSPVKSNSELVFMRSFVCLVLLMPALLIPRPKSIVTTSLSIHFIRGIAGLLNMYTFFYSIRFIPLQDAMVLNNTMPLFVPIVVWIWAKTPLSLKIIPGLILGFMGIILILKPGVELFQPAAIWALASGLFMSISMAGIRELGTHEPRYRILFYYFLISSFFSFFGLFWDFSWPSPEGWWILVGIGVFAFIYQICLTQGFYFASATKVAPLIYFAVVLSGIFDWVYLKQTPSLISYVGTALILIGAIYTLRVQIK